MSKQTAVEWLGHEINKIYTEVPDQLFYDIALLLQKAKEMEKEQINDAHYEGSENYRRQYYKETFESGIGCPNCNESENIHFNTDYSKHGSIETKEFLCNECGAFFTSKLN